MIYYISKMSWLLAAPTSALILISATATIWAVLRTSQRAASLAVAVTCGLVIGAFTPVGIALTVPLENRFAFSQPKAHVPPDGIIVLGGDTGAGIRALAVLSQNFPNARLTLSGYGEITDSGEHPLKRFARLGGDPARVNMETRSRTTAENALYSAALLKPKRSERWLLLTSALHMPRAVGCFRAAGFQVEPYPMEFRMPLHPFAAFAPGSEALTLLDKAAKEWIGLVAYRLMGKTDALFPGPLRASQQQAATDPPQAAPHQDASKLPNEPN
jgi:uncharacterized SAM-binding protein YcdF (DUF218 family)